MSPFHKIDHKIRLVSVFITPLLVQHRPIFHYTKLIRFLRLLKIRLPHNYSALQYYHAVSLRRLVWRAKGRAMRGDTDLLLLLVAYVVHAPIVVAPETKRKRRR